MKRVAIFAYTSDGKVGRGSIDFYNQEAFDKFSAEGGSLVVRSEKEDFSLQVNTPSSSPSLEESGSSEADPD